MTAESARPRCPVCGALAPGSPVAKIDVDTEPEHVLSVVSGRLNRVTCNVCGHAGVTAEPITVQSDNGARIIRYVPVNVPRNRKKQLAGRLERDLATYGKCRTAICFGPAQLRKELPGLPWPETVRGYCQSFDDVGSPRHRETALKRALKVNPESTSLMARLGATLHEQKKLGSARRVLVRAIAFDPTDAEALHCLAALHMDEDEPEEALALYDRVVGLTHDALPRFLAGVAACGCGRYKAAAERLKRALKDQPDMPDAHIWLAVACLKLGDRPAALNALREAALLGLAGPGRILARPELRELEGNRAFDDIVSTLRKRNERETRRQAYGRSAPGRGERANREGGRGRAGHGKQRRPARGNRQDAGR